jgi:hypothetical protein
MKTSLMILMTLMSLPLMANAKVKLDDQFSGKYNYGRFMVAYEPSTGKVRLADTRRRKTYVANVKTGQEFPLDIEFLQFSRSMVIQHYVDYLVSATVAAKLNSTGTVDFIIKAKVNFDGGTTPQAIMVFGATSAVSSKPYEYSSYDGHAYSYDVKRIDSKLRFERIETAEGGPVSGAGNIYQILLSFIAKLWPSDGFDSTIYDF